MISDSVLGIIISSYFLTSVHCSYLRFPIFCLLLNHFFILNLKYSLFKNLSCLFSISILASILLIDDTYPCWDMSCPTCAFCLIYWLTPGSTWTHVLVSNIFVIDNKIKRDWGHYNHGDCRRMNAPFGFCFWNSNNLMHTWLTFHNFISIWPCYF